MSLNNLPQIVQLARRQVGEHYLWGGRGEIPGRGTACSLPGRNVRMEPDSFDPHAPMVPAPRRGPTTSTSTAKRRNRGLFREIFTR